MCVGLPMRVIEAGAGTAICERRGERTRLSTLLVGEVAPGDWVLAFQGSAVRTLTAAEAAETDAALAALEAVLGGADDVSSHFADLVDREPELPAHLRGATQDETTPTLTAFAVPGRGRSAPRGGHRA